MKGRKREAAQYPEAVAAAPAAVSTTFAVPRGRVTAMLPLPILPPTPTPTPSLSLPPPLTKPVAISWGGHPWSMPPRPVRAAARIEREGTLTVPAHTSELPVDKERMDWKGARRAVAAAPSSARTARSTPPHRATGARTWDARHGSHPQRQALATSHHQRQLPGRKGDYAHINRQRRIKRV